MVVIICLPYFKNMFLFLFTSMSGTCPWRPEEDIRFPGAGVTGDRETADVDAGDQTWALCKNKCSSALSRLLRPPPPSHPPLPPEAWLERQV